MIQVMEAYHDVYRAEILDGCLKGGLLIIE
jgi:hypothetical protein